MPLETWFIYIVTVLALMSTPGPSQLLMLSNSAAHGFSRALATAAGDLTANALQMLAAGLGLAAVIAAWAHALTAIKWMGVAYLIWLGARMILHAGRGGKQNAARRKRPSALWLQGFLTSAVNPKAVVFFAALFPQFIDSGLPFWPQFLVLSVTYIAIDGTFLCSYGYGADRIAKWVGDMRRVDRLGGLLMLGAAVLLGLKSVAE